MGSTAILSRSARLSVLLLLVTCAAGLVVAQDDGAAPPMSIQSGTFLTVRINEAITSDRNQVGDVFSGTLTQPLIVQGIVVARRGQTVGGRVVEAKRAGMVAGVSSLGVKLTRLTLADGQSIPVRTQLLVRNGRADVRRDAGTVTSTTAAGAVIGAIAGRGRGAAIGAGVGAGAGALGVLLTRGASTVIYPESVLTFEVLSDVPIDTSVAPQAFHAVKAEDYPTEEAQLRYRPEPVVERVSEPVFLPRPYYVYAPVYPYPYYVRPYYYGPSVNFVFRSPGYRYRSHFVYAPRPTSFRHYGPHPRVFERRRHDWRR